MNIIFKRNKLYRLSQAVMAISILGLPAAALAQNNDVEVEEEVVTGSTFNLRGLGENSTLVLADGVRTINSIVSTMFPDIALARLEVVLDGVKARTYRGSKHA